MSRLPQVKPREMIAALQRAGFLIERASLGASTGENVMDRRSMLSLSAIAAMGLALRPDNADAQQSDIDQIKAAHEGTAGPRSP